LDENEGLNLVAVASFALEHIGIRNGTAKIPCGDIPKGRDCFKKMGAKSFAPIY
jgi:hypothetical protein